MAELVFSVTLHADPPDVEQGTLVEIEVMERKGTAAVYAEQLLFADPDIVELERVLAIRSLLEVSHERYLCGREGEAGIQDTDLWVYIARLLLQAATLLTHYGINRTWSPTSVPTADFVTQAQILRTLISSLRETMLNILRKGVISAAPIWKVLDNSFEDIVRRSESLARAADRVIAKHRSEVASLRFLRVDEYQAAWVNGSSFRNHNDYMRAMEVAERIGLDMSRLVLGLYQNLEVLVVVRGVKTVKT